MATASETRLPPLENGDHLDQKTFHRRYEAMPANVRAELIGGIVYMSSPQKVPHGRSQIKVARWLDEYADATPGTEVLANTTDMKWKKFFYHRVCERLDLHPCPEPSCSGCDQFANCHGPEPGLDQAQTVPILPSAKRP